MISRRDRRAEIENRGYDPGNADEIRKVSGLENILEIVRRRRLTWVAEVLRFGDVGVKTELENERRENGRWWRLVRCDLQDIEVSWEHFVAAVHRGEDIKMHLKSTKEESES